MKTILLIEDNLEMRENTAEILELSGFTVLTAENGKVGVNLAKSSDLDLILCDVMMPELDGFGVLHILSKNPKTASIPFIFLTAKAEKEDFRKGMSLGADDYLTKPFDDIELLDAIEIRLKKTEFLKSKFDNSPTNGLDSFIDESRGVKELEQLSENRKKRKYKKKEIIFYEDDHPHSLFFINEGKIKTYKTNDDGKEYITGLYKTGDFFGYTALLEESSYKESAMVLELCELSLIPKTDFYDLLHKDRNVSSKFIKMLSNEITDTEQRLLQLAYNSVRKRVAESLILLDDRYNNTSSGEKEFTTVITRDDLAKIVGTAKETVIRTLSDFKDEGLITIEGKKIVLQKKDKLIRMKN